jgi:inward rectifier potassium channel
MKSENAPESAVETEPTIESGQPQKLEDLRDLGFGTRASQMTGQRLLNHDGRFNAGPIGLSFTAALDLYHSLLTMSWWRFYITMGASYLLINALFATAFIFLGNGALDGVTGATWIDRWWEAFFFSIHTYSTVGYGDITPGSMAAHWLVTIDTFVGLLSSALATGILFARFSRPTTKILYSERALVAPYRGITAFEFRIANLRRSQLIEVQVQMMMVTIRTVNGKRARQYNGLALERNKVAFFPLTWTVVHPITSDSPMYGMTEAEMREREAEFIILITGIDDTFSQTVHSRDSYSFDEVTWGARFADPFVSDDDGVIRVDLRRFHEIEPAELERDV